MTKLQKRGLKLLSLLLGILIMVQSVSAVSLPDEAEAQQYTYTTLVRSSAGYGAAVLGQMEDGAGVTVLGQWGGFYKVDCQGRTGYVEMNQVKVREDGKYYIACQADSGETSRLHLTTLSNTLSLRAQVLELAKQQLGAPYVYGSSRPGAFDCSGLVYYVYGKLGYDLQRCADTQLQDGLVVAREGLQIGDLVFFRQSGSPWLASHVGIYAGNDLFIHASNSGVIYSSLNESHYSSMYIGARRVLHTSNSTEISATTITSTLGLVSRSSGAGIRTAR